MDVAVTGSSGLIGSALVSALTAAGHRAVRVVRGPATGDAISWDPDQGRIDAGALEGIDAVVHLAGVGIAEHRWRPAQKRAILDSRVAGTTLLATTLARLTRPPRVLVSGSAVGYYGDRGDEQLDESSPGGTGFLSDVCRAWERAAEPAAAAGVRVVRIRTGIVLARGGGALPRQVALFRFGLGGRLGSGRQWQSWIALDDEVAAILHVLARGDVTGAVNLTAPNPVTNRDFTRALGAVLRRPTLFTAPKVALHTVLGREFADELLLSSQRVMPRALERSGFAFSFADLEPALRHVLGRAG